MMIRLLFFVGAFVFLSFAFGQVDSLGLDTLTLENEKELLDLIEKYDLKGDNSLALKYVEHRLNLYEQASKKDTGYAISLLDVGVGYYNLGEFEKSLNYFINSKNIFEGLERGKEHEDYSTSFHQLGICYSRLGQFDLSETNYLKAIEIRKKKKERVKLANSQNALATLYKHLDKRRESKILFKNSYDILKKDTSSLEARIFWGATANNLGIVYFEEENFNQANKYLNDALQIVLKQYGEKNIYTATIILNMAVSNFHRGLFSESEEEFTKAINLFKEINQKDREALATNGLATFYLTVGQFEKASRYYEKSLQLSEDVLIVKTPKLAQFYINYSQLFIRLQEYKKADSSLKEARNILENFKNDTLLQQGLLLETYAHLHVQTNNFPQDSIFRWLMSAKEIITQKLGKTHLRNLVINQKIANVLLETGDFETGLSLIDSSLVIMEKKYGNFHYFYKDLLLTKIDYLIKMNKFDEVNQLYTELFQFILNQFNQLYPYLSEKGQIQYINSIQPFINNYYDYVVKEAVKNSSQINEMQRLSLYFKGLIVDKKSKLLQKVKNSNNQEIQELHQEWKGLRQQYAKWIWQPKDASAKYGIDIDALESQIEQAEKELNQKLNIIDNNSQFQELTTQSLQKSLKTGEAAIDFITFSPTEDDKTNKQYYAILSRFDLEQPLLISLGKESDLANNVKDYIEDNFANRQIYRQIWQPLIPHLKDINTIMLSPSGLLHAVAFEGLITPKGFLLDDYNFYYYSNLRDFIIERTTSKQSFSPQHITLFGDADFGVLPASCDTSNQTVVLPQAEIRKKVWTELNDSTEIKAIKQMSKKINISTTVFEKEAAIEKNFKNNFPSKKPTVFHFSGHGYFMKPAEKKELNISSDGQFNVVWTDNPLFRTGLITGGANKAWTEGKYATGCEDGIITAYELADLDLTNTELMVLSACETGLGDIHNSEGVLGLQRALKQAGVGGILMSLWKVKETETSKLLGLFYENYLERQMPQQEALKKAKETMRQKDMKVESWAGFVLVE